MSFLNRTLDPPSYGYLRDGALYVPTHRELWNEFFRRLDPTHAHNWLPFFGWTATLLLVVPFGFFFAEHFSWSLLFIGLFYSMVLMGSHGTLWLHRYCTHRAYRFSHPLWRTICRNLTIRVIPEEIYVISHHVHHSISDEPGDPYNTHGGWLYCFLADVNHQTLSKTLSAEDYARVCKLMEHTGVKLNNYKQYQRWGSLCHPFWAIAHYAANWAFWYAVFFFIGGHSLSIAIFGMAGVWAFGVRTFNYDGHGRGKDRRQDGIDFNRKDWSINQIWPGYVAGEWHNNHHLYPNGIRSGFLPYQLDLPWIFIKIWRALGLIHSTRDFKTEFLRDHYMPYRLAHPRPPARFRLFRRA